MKQRTIAGRYVLGEEIGRGATSVVHRARDERLGTEVALKLLAPHLAGDPSAVARLRGELLATREIADPAVARVHDVGEDGQSVFVVMELGAKGTLREHLLLHGPLDPVRLDRLSEQLARALAACHGRGVVHRDVKPSNLLYDPDSGEAKLIDFGVARMAGCDDVQASGSVVGTPEYMAPEQFDDPTPDPRSDLYSAGVVLFEAAAGRLPFEGRTLPELVRAHHAGLVERRLDGLSGVGPGLRAVLSRLLRPDPADRFQTAEELADALAGRSAIAGAAPPSPRPDAGSAPCPSCGTRREPGLAFCPGCGTDLAQVDKFGRWSVLATDVPDPEALAEVLDACLPPTAVRRDRSLGRRPLPVLEFASEPMARWLAEQLRCRGIAASTRLLSIPHVLGLSLLAGALLGGLTRAFLLLPVLPLEHRLWGYPVIGGLLALTAAATVRHLRERFGTAVAVMDPLAARAAPLPALEEARRAQAGRRTDRARALGASLITRFVRQVGTGGCEESATRELRTALALLSLVDEQLAALATFDEPAETRARRRDAVLRGTQALLRLSTSWLRRRAAALDAAARRTAGAAADSDVLSGQLEEARAGLSALPGPPR